MDLTETVNTHLEQLRWCPPRDSSPGVAGPPPADGGCHDEGFGSAPAALLCPSAPSAGEAAADEDSPPVVSWTQMQEMVCGALSDKIKKAKIKTPEPGLRATEIQQDPEPGWP